MSKIGKRGFKTTTDRYFFGSAAAHKSWLKTHGLFNYWQQTGLTMKKDHNGNNIWPAQPPGHPAHGEPPW